MKLPSPSLRQIFFTLLVTGVLYAGSGAVYLAFRLGPASASLRADTEAVRDVFVELKTRTDVGDRVIREVRSMVERGDVPDRSAIDGLRRTLGVGPPARTIVRYGSLPDSLLETAGRGSLLTYELRHALLNELALIELGRWSSARAYLATVDSLQSEVQAADRSTQQQALAYLLEQEEAVARSADMVGAVVLSWALVTLLLVPLVLGLVRWRVAKPLGELQETIRRVSRGDLAARVAVRHDDELGSIGRHFNAMAEALGARLKEQGRWAAAGKLLSDAPHELMNPLMAIRGVVGEHGVASDAPPRLAEVFSVVDREARRAERMLKGLVRLATPAHDGVDDAAHVDDVLGEAMSLLSYQFRVDEIRTSVDGVPGRAVAMDPDLLLQALVNLLGNAIDALRDRPKPRRLEARVTEADDVCRITIFDSGERDPVVLEQALSTPFRDGHVPPGTDVGLYIARQIVEAAGGRMAAEPVEGFGTRMLVELPAATLPPVQEPDGAPEARRSSGDEELLGVRILVVDDEETIRRSIGRYLRRLGAVVEEAADGVEALRCIRSRAPDLLLSDLRMPRMDGVELYGEILREHPDLANRTVILTGDVSKLTAFVAQGPSPTVLTKPLDLPELASVLKEELAKAP